MRTSILLCGLVAASASAQSVRSVVQTDANGASITQDAMPGAIGPVLELTPRAGVLWTYNDTVSIPQAVSLGNDGAESWVGHALNDERVSKFTTTGSGSPDFVYSLVDEDPGNIGVDASADSSLCAVLSYSSPGTINVRAFNNANAAVPLWTYTFDASYTNSGQRAVSVSQDGTRAAAVAYDGTNSLVVYFDAADGSVLNTATVSGYCPAVELSADGSRFVLTNGDTARVYDAASMTELHSLSVSGSGGAFRISADGTAIAAGGFNVRAAREISGVWTDVYNGTGSTDWFGYGLALSGDGTTLFVLSHDYGANYLVNEERVVDLTTGNVLATETQQGSGSFQNSAVRAQANQDGTLFACASWGDQANTDPEVRIYDRDLNLVASIDTAGSPFDLDMTPDGHYVLVGTKAVHANTFGNGGNTYAFENDVANECPADVNGDGTLDFFDVQMFLNFFSAHDPAADWNGDATFDFFDAQAYLADFSAGCP